MAASYDRAFTFGTIGKLQRTRVWKWLKKDLAKRKTLKILELNGGTGIDAWWLSNLGHEIELTDASSAMLDESKWLNTPKVHRTQCAFDEVDHQFADEQFDLVFSNFAGLNCIDENDLNELGSVIHKKLRPNGQFIGVFLSNNCWLERLYFTLKRDQRKNRRGNGMSVASLNAATTSQTPIWYHSLSVIQAAFRGFETQRVRPIGLLIPPSYLEPWVRRHMLLTYLLTGLDVLLTNSSWSAERADHLYISMRKK